MVLASEGRKIKFIKTALPISTRPVIMLATILKAKEQHQGTKGDKVHD